MRLAKLNDYKRKIAHAVVEKGVSCVTNPSGDGLSLHLVNSICGLNGAGKTRLLRAIEMAGGQSVFEGYSIEHKGTSALYVIPSILVSESLAGYADYKKDGDIQDVIDQYDPYSFDADLLKSINYILHARFTQVDVYNIEVLEDGASGDEESGEKKTFACCVAKKDDFRLDNESLSHGEIYIILLLWLLRTSDGYSTVLIDEAETFLSPVAQTRLSNTLIKISAAPREGNVQIIASTHSPFILDAIGYENSFSIEKKVDGISFGRATKRVLDRIGIATSVQNIVLVEDAKARFLVSHIFDALLPAWKHNNVLIYCDGEGDLGEIKNRVKGTGGSKLVLVYDGDVKGNRSFSEEEKKFSLTLPGHLAPEQELICQILKCPKDYLEMFGEEVRDSVSYGIELHAGGDHHDFFIELSRVTNISELELSRSAFHLWLRANKVECQEFVDRFSEMTA